MVNKAFLLGNVGKDPELRSTQGGTAVCTLSIATSERVKDRDGTWTDKTEWHNVVCFGTTAENVAKYVRKGKQVHVEGKIQTRKWQDKEGKDRWTTEIIADRVQFLGGKEDGGGRRDERSYDDRQPRTDRNAGSAPRGSAGPDEEIPF